MFTLQSECQDRTKEDDLYQEGEWLVGQIIDFCKCYVFQLESAPTTGQLHFQGYLELNNKNRFEFIQSNLWKFDFLQERKGTQLQAWNYASKLETRLLGPWSFGQVDLIEGKKDTTYVEAMACSTVREAMAIVKLNKPRDFCLYGSTIERNLSSHHQPVFKHPFQIGDFNRPALNFSKSALVYGNSNTGKTSFVLAHFKNPLVVSHVDTLKKLSPDHDAIVFDDMSFAHWPAETVIHLLDVSFARDLHVRYGTVHIPANTVKIFTHNTKEIFYKSDISDVQRSAIERRVEYFHVKGPLYGPSPFLVVNPILKPVNAEPIYNWSQEDLFATQLPDHDGVEDGSPVYANQNEAQFMGIL